MIENGERMKTLNVDHFKNFAVADRLVGMSVTFGEQKRIWIINKVKHLAPKGKKSSRALRITFDAPQIRKSHRTATRKTTIYNFEVENAIVFLTRKRTLKVHYDIADYPMIHLAVPRKIRPLAAFSA